MAASEVDRGDYVDARAIPFKTEAPVEDRSDGLLLVDSGVTRFPPPENVFDKGARRTDNNLFWSSTLLLNYTFGITILNTGQVFNKSGILAATFLYIIAGTAIYLSEVLLVLAAEVVSSGDPADAHQVAESGSSATGSAASIHELEYTVVARRTLGRRGAKAVDAFIFLQNFGLALTLLILLGGLTTSVLSEWTETETSNAFARLWYSFYFVTPVMVVLFVLPPSLIRHFSNVRWLAVFSVSAVLAVVLLIVFRSPAYAEDQRSSSNPDPALSAPIRSWNWTGAFSKVGSILLAANCTPAVFHCYNSMETRTGSEWKRVVGVSVTIGNLTYCTTGLVAYLSFRAATEADILDNFEGVLASCFKVLVVVHIVVYISSEIIILRHSAFALADADVMEAPFYIVLGVTLAIFAFLVGIVFGLMLSGIAEGDLFGHIADLTGGLSSSMVGLVLPGLIYLEATRGIDGMPKVAWYRRGCYALVILGTLTAIAVPTSVVLSALGYD